MAAPRWAVRCAAVAALASAVAYNFLHRASEVPDNANGSVFCYDHIKTHNDGDDGEGTARCFGVENGVFTSVSADKQAAGLARVFDQPGHVLPGLWDGHGHMLQYGEFLTSVDLHDAQTLDEVRASILRYLDANPDAGSEETLLRGSGWFRDGYGQVPTAEDIAAHPRLRDLYIVLDSVDLHCILVSPAVLAALPPDFPDVVDGGEIVRNPGRGIFCDNAADMVWALMPQPSQGRRRAWLSAAMDRLAEAGVVGVHDAGVTRPNVDLFERLADEGALTTRVYLMFECVQRNAFCPAEVKRIEREDGMVTLRSVKLFSDGALGSRGSALLAPYSDQPSTSGSLLINGSQLATVTEAWSQAGYQVNIHAIGDLANRVSIDAIESSLRALCPPSSGSSSHAPLVACQSAHRFRIEHAQIIDPADQVRMQHLGILPSVQPTHATSDMPWAVSRLGEERLAASAYRIRSYLPLGPVLGSDFPVEPPDPLHGVFAAVSRRNPRTGRGADGETTEGWHLEEAIGVRDALRGFTMWPAWGAFMEARAGKIAEGMWADWIVLGEAVDDGMDVDRLREMKVLETWVAGKRVFPKPNSTGAEKDRVAHWLGTHTADTVKRFSVGLRYKFSELLEHVWRL